ncbi:hypothetical protein KCP76_07760 [Salmonella enterica subsp. enterica serovar Weltevreden]|nr:hypothetical protein KCP76_07760 [Salmonella enterica subsp. enterica serovar Weltevreden]
MPPCWLFYRPSALDKNAAGCEINGAAAAFAIICDVLCGHNVSSKARHDFTRHQTVQITIKAVNAKGHVHILRFS